MIRSPEEAKLLKLCLEIFELAAQVGHMINALDFSPGNIATEFASELLLISSESLMNSESYILKEQKSTLKKADEQ